jgi:dephospho-CoA kinase
LTAYQGLSFETVLRHLWTLGIAVLPLNDPGRFHGACWRITGRNIIVLKQRTRSRARWLHDLLHEYWHAASDPHLEEYPVIEDAELSPSRRLSAEELEASEFAGDVVLAGKAEDLVHQCVSASSGNVQRLKTVVPQVAQSGGVPVDALANYVAFRLSLQGINWWGAATNLQGDPPPSGRTPRDLLLEHLDMRKLNEVDRDLLMRALEPLVLAVSGRIGSGKTTVASGVANALGWKRASFGEFVRAVARSQGLDDRREVLQEVGARLVEKGTADFCRSLLAHFHWESGEPLVVDGVRHREILESLRALVSPLQVRLVYVDVDDEARQRRLTQLGELTTSGQLGELDSHSTEREVTQELAAAAAFRVSGTRPVDEIVRDIVEWVQKGDGDGERAA